MKLQKRDVVQVIAMLSVCFLAWVVLSQFIAVYRVQGKSMYPTLRRGDYVVVQKGIEDDMTNQVVIFFDCRGERIIHRVIEDDGQNVLTKGDHNFVADGWISKKSVVGVVLFRVQREIMFLSIFCCLAFLTFDIAWMTYKAHKEETKNGNSGK